MKLCFSYGAMGSSKSAQALITRFNFIEKGRKVALVKPETDTRAGANIVESRIGLREEALVLGKDQDVTELMRDIDYEIMIVDEAQFLSKEQVDELRELADNGKMIKCYGLRADFRGELFPGSKRLLELADSISEVKTMCECGRKAIMNARLDKDGYVTTTGEQVLIGGNERYIALCHKCFIKRMRNK